VAAVDEVDSACIDDALALLGGGQTNVVVYFAHLAATACDGSPRQDQLTAALDAHLREGGGVVVFHHGIYEAGGKESILQLLGGRASSIAWDTAAGQDVIMVGGDHFVTSQALQPSGTVQFSGAGVPGGEYPFWNNTPDERYDALELLTEGGEQRTILFAGGGGAPRVLGYDLRRAAWMGHVVFYQPGEYQPNALDLDGNNFQVLANAIYYVASTQDEPTDPTGADTGTPGDDDTGSASADGTGGEAGEGEAGSTGAGTGAGTIDADTGAGADGSGGEDGCGCRSTTEEPGALALLMGLWGLVSRRRRRA
jgi:MYXO-CTERM domain-containing protein